MLYQQPQSSMVRVQAFIEPDPFPLVIVMQSRDATKYQYLAIS